MITITLKEIIDGINVLKEVSMKQLPGRAAFQLARILREVEKEYTLFQKNRQALIEKYGEKGENGVLLLDEEQKYHINKEDILIFNKEIDDLINSLVGLNVNQISLEDLESETFTPQQMMVLEPFIED